MPIPAESCGCKSAIIMGIPCRFAVLICRIGAMRIPPASCGRKCAHHHWAPDQSRNGGEPRVITLGGWSPLVWYLLRCGSDCAGH